MCSKLLSFTNCLSVIKMGEESSRVSNINVCIVALMGIPGSGKSTFTQTFIDITKEIPDSVCVILRYDEFVPVKIQRGFPHSQGEAKIARRSFIRSITAIAKCMRGSASSFESNEVFAEADETSSSELLSALRTKCANMLNQCKQLLQEKRFKNAFLVIDDNNYYQSMRSDIYQVAKQLNTSFCVLYLTCPLSVALERNLHRPEVERIPTEVIQEMERKLEEPNPIENQCDLYCIQICTTSGIDDSLKSSLASLLTYSLTNPVIPVVLPDRTEDRRICSENEIHQADIILRKWVSSQLTIASFTTHSSVKARKERSEQLINLKSTTLEKLRRGEYKILSCVEQDVEFQKEIISLAQLANPGLNPNLPGHQ